MENHKCIPQNQQRVNPMNGARKITQTNGGAVRGPMDNRIDMSTHHQTPLFTKSHSIPITIKRFYTDVNGTIIAKGLVAAALQVPYPFFTLGYFDMQGGFSYGLRTLPPTPGTYYLLSFVEGMSITSQQITGFSGMSTIRQRLKLGDIVHVYTDDLDAPNRFIWIVQSSRNGSLASIIANTNTAQKDNKIGCMGIEHFQYFTDNTDPQWRETLQFIRCSNIGTVAANQVNPYTFKDPHTEQDGFIRIRTEMTELNQFLGVGTYFLFATDEIQFNYLIRS